MKTVCTASQENATVRTATDVIRTSGVPTSVEALSNANPTPSRLARLAAIKITSAAVRELSSLVAIRSVVAASAPCTATHTQRQNARAVASQARSVAACHGDTAAAATPTTRPTPAHQRSRTRALARRLLRSMPPAPVGHAATIAVRRG